MKFSLLLFILNLKLKKAARSNAAFRTYIATMRASILIKTEDGRRARLFVFDRGAVSSVSGDAKEYDVALVWSDAATAFRVMAAASDEASFRAAAEGKLRVEGMAIFAMWFTEGVTLIL